LFEFFDKDIPEVLKLVNTLAIISKMLVFSTISNNKKEKKIIISIIPKSS
jgi:hypothetical protein